MQSDVREAPAPFLVPCLVVLRSEFNTLAPKRDKGADGWIGDAAHQHEISDHNADSKGRVLAVDIDSTGPWPASFDSYVQTIVARQKAGYDGRLEYVIWNRRIASRTSKWEWLTYTSTTDPHTGHAHFSARHDHTGQDDKTPWDFEEELPVNQDQFNDLMDGWASSPNGKAALVTGARGALNEAAYGPVTARESIALRIANLDQKIDPLAAGVDELVAQIPAPTA